MPQENFLEALKKEGLDCARRPTGGGILFHMTDLAFSVLVPSSHAGYSTNTLANYAYINNKVTEAIHKWSGNRLSPVLLSKQAEKRSTFCMAQPTQYDVMIDGKKVGGAAQRRMKQGFLHQGTISLWPPSEELLKKILLPGSEILEEMQKNSYFLLSQDLPLHERLQAKKDLRLAMEAVFLQN